MKQAGIALVLFATLTALSYPLVSLALAPAELQSQIQDILAHVLELKAVLDNLEHRATLVSQTPESDPLCFSLSRALSRGSGGEDVRDLQNVLIREKVLEDGNATGYFGVLTEAAVKRWQTSHGIVSSGDGASTGFGVVGAKTRAVLLANCARDAENVQRLQASTTSLSASTSVPARIAPAQGPSITLSAPLEHTVVVPGDTLRIAWESFHASSQAVVSLSLIDENNKRLGTIAQKESSSGEYLWHVPHERSDCVPGESAFDCILQIAQCEGSSTICALPAGVYRIVAALSSTVSTTSSAFRVVGSAASNLVEALLGSFSSSSGYDLAPPSASSTFVTLDVSQYQGTGAGSGSAQSGSGTGCPQEGWHAYLACPYGGCTTGWNVCRGGVWVLDTVQETVIVGTQGSCKAGEVWCGVGTGFGCVASAQCVNGKALGF